MSNLALAISFGLAALCLVCGFILGAHHERRRQAFSQGDAG